MRLTESLNFSVLCYPIDITLIKMLFYLAYRLARSAGLIKFLKNEWVQLSRACFDNIN